MYSGSRQEAARRQQKDAVARRHDGTAARRRLLLGARTSVSAQFHVEVQGDSRRDSASSPAA